MREQNGRGQDKESLVKGLKEKLNWYTMCASDAEFDEKAVESILYLLEHLEPLEKTEVPEMEGSWERFQAFVRERDGKNIPEMDAMGKPEAVGAEEIRWTLEPVEVEEIPGMPEAVGLEEFLGTPEPVEMEEIPGMPEPDGVEEYLGKPRTVGAERGSGRSNFVEVEEILGTPEPVEVESVSGRPNLVEAEKVSDSLEPVEAEGSLGKSNPVEKSELMDKSASVGVLGKGKETEISEELGISAEAAKRRMPARTDYTFRSRISRNLAENQKGAVVYNKYIVAAVLLLLVISIVGAVGNVTVGASPDTGFFHWLKRDNTGIQMVASPEDLDSEADMQGVHIYKSGEDVPGWAKEWLKIDDEFEMPESYKWSRYEIEECRNFHKITSVYKDITIKSEILLGMLMYHGDISLNTEGFAGYNYIDSYETFQQQMNVYSKLQTSGKEYFIISFYEKECQYFMQGQDLDELKGLIEQYWLQVKNNLEKNEIICNKMLSQAIYK